MRRARGEHVESPQRKPRARLPALSADKSRACTATGSSGCAAVHQLSRPRVLSCQDTIARTPRPIRHPLPTPPTSLAPPSARAGGSVALAAAHPRVQQGAGGTGGLLRGAAAGRRVCMAHGIAADGTSAKGRYRCPRARGRACAPAYRARVPGEDPPRCARCALML